MHIIYILYLVENMNFTTNNEVTKNKIQYRKIQGLVGEHSFSLVLPKFFAINLGMGKGDFVKVYQQENKIIIEKA